MTSRELTGLLPLDEDAAADLPLGRRITDWCWRLTFGFIGWPWLLRSLYGGTQAAKRALIARLDLAPDALPHLGSWKADTAFLHRIVDTIEEHRPRTVVELGAGASSLVAARALQLHGGGHLVSYDQHGGFVDATRRWLADNDLPSDIRHAPLTAEIPGWGGRWYAIEHPPERIDMLIIDGPPWAVHPLVRGAAESLFPRLSPGAVVMLDDAARPGERIVARRWRRNWPGMDFTLVSDGTKGTLVGIKGQSNVIPFRGKRAAPSRWAPVRAVAGLALVAALGWLARDQWGPATPPAAAATSFVDEAAVSHQTSLLRVPMRSQLESTRLDRGEIAKWTGLDIPAMPVGWTVRDVQLYPGAKSPAVEVSLVTDRGEAVSLFTSRAETPAGATPLIARREGKNIAYWEDGATAHALTGALTPARMLALAAAVQS